MNIFNGPQQEEAESKMREDVVLVVPITNQSHASGGWKKDALTFTARTCRVYLKELNSPPTHET